MLSFRKSGVVEANGNVRISIRNPEIAVCVHALYRIGQNSLEPLPRRRPPQDAMYLPPFLVLFMVLQRSEAWHLLPEYLPIFITLVSYAKTVHNMEYFSHHTMQQCIVCQKNVAPLKSE